MPTLGEIIDGLLKGVHREFAQGLVEMSIYLHTVMLEGNIESCEDNNKCVCE